MRERELGSGYNRNRNVTLSSFRPPSLQGAWACIIQENGYNRHSHRNTISNVTAGATALAGADSGVAAMHSMYQPQTAHPTQPTPTTGSSTQNKEHSPQLEAHLVVALAGGAVGHRISTHLRHAATMPHMNMR